MKRTMLKVKTEGLLKDISNAIDYAQQTKETVAMDISFEEKKKSFCLTRVEAEAKNQGFVDGMNCGRSEIIPVKFFLQSLGVFLENIKTQGTIGTIKIVPMVTEQRERYSIELYLDKARD